jgi:hypothetical protein
VRVLRHSRLACTAVTSFLRLFWVVLSSAAVNYPNNRGDRKQEQKETQQPQGYGIALGQVLQKVDYRSSHAFSRSKPPVNKEAAQREFCRQSDPEYHRVFVAIEAYRKKTKKPQGDFTGQPLNDHPDEHQASQSEQHAVTTEMASEGHGNACCCP